MYKYLLFPLVAIVLSLCLPSCHNGSARQLRAVTDSFSTAYFNWRFADALPHATAESRPWLVYAASQVTQQDVDSLRAMREGATCEIIGVDYDDNGMTATATVRVRHFLAMDSIGRAPHLVSEGVYILPLLYQHEKWKVHLRQLPRRQ